MMAIVGDGMGASRLGSVHQMHLVISIFPIGKQGALVPYSTLIWRLNSRTAYYIEVGSGGEHKKKTVRLPNELDVYRSILYFSLSSLLAENALQHCMQNANATDSNNQDK